MIPSKIQSNLLLLITAAIWGFSFVYQRTGMEHVGPFTFNAVRFALGTLSLLPIGWWLTRRHGAKPSRQALYYGVIAGVFLFLGSSFQQVGIQYTTAGKAGFITGLYIVFIPIVALFLGEHTRRETWIGCAFALSGLYLLSVTEGFTLAYGDSLVLVSALIWTGHVLVIARFSPRVSVITLSIVQFAVCSLLSMAVALTTESIEAATILAAGDSILFTGLLSVGVAYTLQVIAQQNAHPAHAAIILSLESLFAVIGGWTLLNEVLTDRALIGCGLMLAGMVISQLKLFKIPPHIGKKPMVS